MNEEQNIYRFTPINNAATTTTSYIPPTPQPTPQLTMVATLNQASLEVIRQIMREELQRQEGFIRAVVQEELESYHNAYYAAESGARDAEL